MTRRIKAVFVLVCVGAVAWIVAPALTELGERESLWTELSFVGLILAPSLTYAAVIDRRVPVVVFGSALAALELWSIWAALTGESSTSALAILWIPFVGIPLVLLGWLLQTWSRPEP